MPRIARTARALCALVAALVVGVPATALAAPATWQSIDITLHGDGSRSVFMVSGELPASTPLPAEVRLPVPTGTQLQWAGEVLGGPVANDPEVQAVKTTVGDQDVYTFTLTKARTAQIEVVTTAAETFDGSRYATLMRWTPLDDTPSLRISARLKSGATVVSPAEGAAVLPAGEGVSYYSKSLSGVKAGTPVELAFAYTVSAGASSAASANSADATIPLVIISLIAVGAILGGAVAVRRRLVAKAAGDRMDEGDDGEAGDTDPSEAGAPRADGPRRGPGPRVLVTGAILLVLVVVVIVLAGQATSSAFVGGTLTRNFGGAGACTALSAPLTVADGADLEDDAGRMLDALKGMPSIGAVTVTLEPPAIKVEYCESTLTEQQVREALESAGVATLGAGTVSPADGSAGSTPTTSTP